MAKLNYGYCDCIEIGMTKQDVLMIAQSCCQNDESCKIVSKKRYIKRQLKDVTTEKMHTALKSWAVSLDGNETREDFIEILLWLIAWNLKEEKEL